MGKKHTLADVETLYMSYGYILIEEEYINSKHRMKMYCPDCDTEQTLRLNDLTQGHKCPGCGIEKKAERARELAVSQRSTHNDIKEELTRRNLKLIGKYKTARVKIKFKCPKHPNVIQETTIGSLRECECCALCSKEQNKLSYEEVAQRFKDRGYKLLSTKYENSLTKMYYRCEKHVEHLQETDVSTITQGHGCYYCGIEKYSGENHYRYNENLTQHDREYNRKYDLEVPKWRIAVFRRDNFTCQLCGCMNHNLNAHHKDGFNWNKERRYEMENGVTLCVDCHKDFHRTYGYGNNTEVQFEQYKKSKRGER